MRRSKNAVELTQVRADAISVNQIKEIYRRSEVRIDRRSRHCRIYGGDVGHWRSASGSGVGVVRSVSRGLRPGDEALSFAGRSSIS